MKKIVSKSAQVVMISTIVLGVIPSVNAEVIEFYQLGSVARLSAPLPVIPLGTSYSPLFPPYKVNSVLKPWGQSSLGVSVVQPSIPFGVDDNKGAHQNCAGRTYPKHLGTDYAAPVNTPVYAIADGVIKRAGGFTNAGDYYVVVESGSTHKWTTLYGHLRHPGFTGTNLVKTVKKGDYIGLLFDFRTGGDVPHLHLGIRQGKYQPISPSPTTMGFACAEDSTYKLNQYNFVSPQKYWYYTKYYQ